MTKVLITGGNSFIGRNLFEQLSSEYNLVSCNSKELNLLDTNIVYDYLKKNKFDVILHTANWDEKKTSIKDPAKVLENNLKMFFNIERCKNYFGKMIFFGSGSEFGREYWKPKMKEDYIKQNVPSDQYGFSKYVMTNYTELCENIYNLRLFAVFGKYEEWRVRFISNACCRVISNMPIRIRKNVFYDFLYIDDLIKIVKWFIDNKPRHHVYNVCTGIVQDLISIAEKILEITNSKNEIEIENEGVGIEYSGDNSLLLRELSINFDIIDNSIKSLYRWYEINKTIIKKEEL